MKVDATLALANLSNSVLSSPLTMLPCYVVCDEMYYKAHGSLILMEQLKARLDVQDADKEFV